MSIETLKAPPAGAILPDLSAKLPPPPKHNQELPDPEKIVFFDGRMGELEEEKKKLAARMKRLKTQMVNQGISVGMFNQVRAIIMLDPETQLRNEELRRHYLMAFDAPLGTQLSLFPVDLPGKKLSQQELMDKAFKSGRNLGINGKDPDEQAYPPHTDLGQEHRKGWNAGQKVNHEFFLAINEETDEQEADAARAKEAKLAEKKKAAEAKAEAQRQKIAKKLAAKTKKAGKKK